MSSGRARRLAGAESSPARAVSCSGIGPIAEVSEVGVSVEGPAVSGSVVVDLAVTRSALGASCRSEGRWARSRVRGKRVDGRVCSVTVAAVRLKEVWLCDPEGIRRPEPHPGVHLHAVKGKLSCIGLSIKYQFTAIVYMVRQCMRRIR